MILAFQAGWVNGVAWSKNGSCVAVAVGQEHRLGRWWRDASAKNGVAFIKLAYSKTPIVREEPVKEMKEKVVGEDEK